MTLRSLILAFSLLATTLGATAAQAQYYHPHHHWHDGDRYSARGISCAMHGITASAAALWLWLGAGWPHVPVIEP